MVLVFTTNANESGQIRREIERAVNRGVAILPIRIEDILPARALEYFIGNVHWLDALTPPLESHLQNLAGTVKLLLGRLPQHGAPVPLATPNEPPTFSQAEPVPRPNVIPQASYQIPPPQAQPIAPERPAWTERVPEEPPQQIPVERAAEVPSWTVSKQTNAPPVPPPTTSAVYKPKRAIGIVVIAAVVFLFSAVAIIGTLHDSIYARFNSETALGLLYGVVGIAASYGLITKKRWGWILQIIFSAAGIIWLLTLTQDAFSDSKDVMPWLGGFGFSALFSGTCSRRGLNRNLQKRRGQAKNILRPGLHPARFHHIHNPDFLRKELVHVQEQYQLSRC